MKKSRRIKFAFVIGATLFLIFGYYIALQLPDRNGHPLVGRIPLLMEYKDTCDPPAEEVFVANAVEHFLKKQSKKISGLREDGTRDTIEILIYESPEELISENPGCCFVTQDYGDFGPPPFAWQRSHNFHAIVDVEYMWRRTRRDGSIRYTSSRERVWMDSCGQPITDLEGLSPD